MTAPRRIIVAVTGASGAAYGHRLLRALHATPEIETHLIISTAGQLTLRHELDLEARALQQLATVTHAVDDIGAAIASGSFGCDAMVVAPCSMRTLAAVAHGLADNLIARAADVMLKERRRLVLLVREAPLNLAHLHNMTRVTEMGGIIYPASPGFYHRPQRIDDLIDHTVGRMLDLLAIPHALGARWQGLGSDTPETRGR